MSFYQAEKKLDDLKNLIIDKDLSDIEIKSLNLSTRLFRTLNRNNIFKVKDILKLDGTERGLGLKGVMEMLRLFSEIEQDVCINNLYEAWYSPLKKILDELDYRSRQIVKKRFGLNADLVSLKQLGKDYGLSRQRISQIENKALMTIKRKLGEDVFHKTPVGKEVYSLAKKESKIKNITTHCYFEYNIEGLIKLFVKLYPEIFMVTDFGHKTKNLFFVLRKKTIDIINEINLIISELNKIGGRASIKNVQDEIDINLDIVLDLKSIGTDGDLIFFKKKQKNKVDVLEQILRTNKKPMSVYEIAKIVGEKAHNVREALLRSSRTVNIGKSIYALKEWGYIEGDTSDVIKHFLNLAQEPLRLGKIISLVKKHRDVKDESIYMALVNDKDIQRLDKGIYALRKWGYEEEYKVEKLSKIIDIYKHIKNVLLTSDRPITANQIKKQIIINSGVHKIQNKSIYNYLEQLVKKGIVYKSKVGKNNYYSLVNKKSMDK